MLRSRQVEKEQVSSVWRESVDLIAKNFQGGSRYMMPEGGCKPAADDAELAANAIVRPYLDAAGANPSTGARVVACIYSYYEGGDHHGPKRQGFGVFLDLPPALIAGWIASACRAALPANVHTCGLALVKNVDTDNGGSTRSRPSSPRAQKISYACSTAATPRRTD
jgi:hypothetical protein